MFTEDFFPLLALQNKQKLCFSRILDLREKRLHMYNKSLCFGFITLHATRTTRKVPWTAQCHWVQVNPLPKCFNGDTKILWVSPAIFTPIILFYLLFIFPLFIPGRFQDKLLETQTPTHEDTRTVFSLLAPTAPPNEGPSMKPRASVEDEMTSGLQPFSSESTYILTLLLGLWET